MEAAPLAKTIVKTKMKMTKTMTSITMRDIPFLQKQQET